MSVDIKRHISEVDDSHDSKKQYTKPGRKQIDTEPKSKRTAQNRAAQRAYRERKEKRMQELEEKVKNLEDTNIQVTTESDFLKAQVDMLKNELSRYRGHHDFLDIQLPTKVGRLTNPQKKSTTSSSVSSTSSASSMGLNGFGASSVSPNDFSWNTKSSNSGINKFVINQNLPDLVGGGSSSSSSLPLDNLVSPDSNPNTVSSTNYDGTALDLGIKFEEDIDPFCANLNEACGNKDYIVPKYKAAGNGESFTTTESPFATLIEESQNFNRNNNVAKYEEPNLNFASSNSASSTNPNTTNSDPLSFLNDDINFDVSLAFGDNFSKTSPDFDPISLLTTEESIYDPLNAKRGSNATGTSDFDFNDYVQHNTGTSNSTVASLSPDVNSSVDDNSDENEVVPAPEETVKCSEIWDRITSHPRYTDIDIDSLCNELKNKAKCSEKGVVINSSDVSKLLEESVSKLK